MSIRAADVAGCAGSAAVAALLALSFLVGVVPLDEGALVHTADRLASGEVLYRDVATGIMPGSYYLHALLFRAFGPSLLAGRILMIVLFSGSTAAMYLLARSVAPPAVSVCVSLSWAAVSVGFWRYPNYSPQAIAWILLALAAAAAHLRGGGKGWLVACGLLLGTAALFKQNYGFLAAVGVAAGIFALGVSVAERVRRVLRVAAAALVPPLGALLGFAAAGALPAFFHDTIVLPLRLPATLFARGFPPLVGSPGEALQRQLVEYLPFQDLALWLGSSLYRHLGWTMLAVRLTFYLPLAGLCAAGWLFARRAAAAGDDPRQRALGALFLASGALLFLGVFPRVDAHHLAMVLPPLFLLAAWVAGDRRRPWVTRVLGWGTAVLLGLSLASQAAAVGSLNPLFRPDLRRLDFPRGGVWVAGPLARQIESMRTAVEREVPAGEPLFVAPAMPLYSFLLDRPNPTRYPLILPGALDEAEVIRSLEEQQVRVALLADYAFENLSLRRVAPRVWDYLHQRFGPYPGLGWDEWALPPYLRLRGAPPGEGLELPPLVLRAGGADGEQPSGQRLPPGGGLPGRRVVADLMGTWEDEPPSQRVASRAAFGDPQAERIVWGLTYLQPVLKMVPPWGWRKLATAWEVPAEPGTWFEFAVALGPSGWGDAWSEQEGGIVEIWVVPVGRDGQPRRAWIRWLDPGRVREDRRWLPGAVDIGSFAAGAPRARVVLVAGPSPAFGGGGAEAVWTGLRVSREGSGGPASSGGLAAEPSGQVRPVAVSDRTAEAVLRFEPRDLPLFQEAARRYGHLPRAHAALAEVAASVGRPELVLAARRRAAGLDPGNAVYRVRLGEALDAAGRPREAVAELRAAIDLEPAQPNYAAALAALLLRQGRLPEARQAAEAALAIDPGHAWALTTLSALARQSGRPEEAAEAARAAVAREPGSLRARLDLVLALREAGRPEEALEELRVAAPLARDPGGRAVVARAYLALGRPDAARRQARAAVEANPREFGAWAALGDAAAAVGEPGEAVAAWRRAVELQPDRFEARFGLGRVLGLSGEAAEALAALGLAEEAAGTDSRSWKLLAVQYDRMRQPDPAAAAWRRVLALDSGGTLGDEARRRLAAPPPGAGPSPS